MKDETWGWREEKGRVESEDEKEGDEGGREGGGAGRTREKSVCTDTGVSIKAVTDC